MSRAGAYFRRVTEPRTTARRAVSQLSPPAPSRSTSAAGSRAYRWLVPAVVAAATIAAFLPILGNGFVDWDDDKNFINNPHFRGLGVEQLRWMWTTFHMGHYIPLSWMTLGLDYDVWGMNAGGYHLTSLLLHAANAVVVFALLRCLLASAGGGRWAVGDGRGRRAAAIESRDSAACAGHSGSGAPCSTRASAPAARRRPAAAYARRMRNTEARRRATSALPSPES